MEIGLTKNFHPVSVENLEKEFEITILAIDKQAHPESADKIHPGNEVLVLGEIKALRRLKLNFC